MNNPQEVQVLSNKELEQITQELANKTQPTPKTQEQINQESKAIMEKAVQDSKQQLDNTVKDLQIMYIMAGLAIVAIGILKILIKRWIKKAKRKKSR